MERSHQRALGVAFALTGRRSLDITSTMTVAVYVGIAVTAVLSCGWDLWQRRIPNPLTLASAVLALGVHASAAGASGAAFSVGGWLTGLALFLPWFLAGGLGGGDVKLLAAFGAWLGPFQTIRACLFAMLAGGAVALVVVCRRRRFRQTMRALGGLALKAAAGRAAPSPVLTGGQLGYALPIAAGVGLALWLR